MRMQELCKATGLQKRTIHYYIKERMIEPSVDDSNGYYDFTEEDVTRLLLVKELRHAGFSIEKIRALLHTPQSAAYYFCMQKTMIKLQMSYLEKTAKALDSIVTNLPFNPTFDDLLANVLHEQLPIPPEETVLKEETYYDCHLTNHFLWRGFMIDENMTEYQQFLWNKLLRKTADPQKNPDHFKLYQYLSNLDSDRIVSLYNVRSETYREVYELRDEDMASYADRIIEAVRTFVSSEKLTRIWKQNYSNFYRVSTDIYTSPLSKTAQEMLPFFKVYTEKINQATQLAYEYLMAEDGQPLLKELTRKLGYDLDIENSAHGELEAIHTLVKEYR